MSTNGAQLKLDFSPRPVMGDPGKKTERVTFTCSQEYKEFLDLFCRQTGNTASELCHRYILEGMRDDLARLLMAQPHLDKSLRELLSKKF